MSTDSSFETFPQFGDCQDTQAIPPISSFAKRNTQVPTSPVSEQFPQPAGFYRELTVEELDSDDPMPRSSQVTTSHHVMEPRSHQQCDKAAVYQMPSQIINSMAPVTNMAPFSTAASAMAHNGSVPTTPGAEMMSPPLHVGNSSLLAQALQVGNDMAGLHQQLQQQQQQLLQAMHTAQAQYDGQKMMTSPTCSDQSLNSQETSPNMNPTDHRHARPALASFPSHAVPVSIQRIDPTNVLTMAQSSQLHAPIHSQSHSRIPTPPIMADIAYNMTSSTDSESSPGMMATMTMPGSYMQPQPMAMSHQMFVPSPEAASPEMVVSDESMLDQMASGITNNNDDELMSNNMPVQCQQTSTSKRRNRKKPVPTEDKDEKYFERRDRNNLAAKRSRDSRKNREDHVSMRANFLQKENDILRAQLATLRQEANSLRQLLSQQRPIATAHMPMQMSMQMFPNTKTMGP